MNALLARLVPFFRSPDADGSGGGGGTAVADPPADKGASASGQGSGAADPATSTGAGAATGGAGAGKGAAAPSGAGAAEAPKAAAASSAASDAQKPEVKLVLPENASITSAVLDQTLAIARDAGWSQEHAQKAVNLIDAVVQSRTKAELDALTAQIAQWEKDALADPKLGSTPDERKAAVQRGHQVLEKFITADPEAGAAFKSLLGKGVAANPATQRFFAWLGKSAGEGSHVTPGTQGTPTVADQAAKMFPSMKPTT